MAKLIYLRQSAEPRTREEVRDWFQECAREATTKGCAWQRHSVHPDDDSLTLVEGWDTKPEHEGGQRWQMQAAE